jgi:hypothetical protein
MLLFTIHGVATRDVTYASNLKKNVKSLLEKDNQDPVFLCSGFWGNALSDIDQMWAWIDQDIRLVQQENPSLEVEDCLRYKKFRETFLSEFAGDMFTYLNPRRGRNIRKSLYDQLATFIADKPNETELHIVAHSLGTVILWDMLFSERFQESDPAISFRQILQGTDKDLSQRQVQLRSVTTMGSPILFFNTMLDVKSENIKSFVDRKNCEFNWLNIIHPSDIIAYPLKSCLALTESDRLQVRDVYVDMDANIAAKVARSFGQNMAGMALDSSCSHNEYWNYVQVAKLIVENIERLSDSDEDEEKHLENVIDYLKLVPGMTIDRLRLHSHDRPEKVLHLADGSGKLLHVVNATQIHHVYLFNKINLCCFSGYVGWMHTRKLQKAIDSIEKCWS